MRFVAVKRVTDGSASVGETPYATPTANGGISISGATALTGGGACCAGDGAGALVAGVDVACCCGCAKLVVQTAHAQMTSAASKTIRIVRDTRRGLFMAARVYRERCVR